MKEETPKKNLHDRIHDAVSNDQMRAAVKKAVERLSGNKEKASEELGSWEDWREQGRKIRQHTIDNLDYYLSQLAENIRKNGGLVHFCREGHDAVNIISEICRSHSAKLVVKSKSMVTEEIHLNKHLIKEGLDVVETDLAEYILQLAGEPPSHIIVPAIHKNRHQIAELFSQVTGEQVSSETPALTAFARKILREKFLQADIGITGCNFAIAENGFVTLVTNEGNARICAAAPKVVIAVMGMERVLPTIEDFESLISLLPRSATGQKMTSYITLSHGKKRDNELDGAEEFHLVIVDNGRSRLLKDEHFRQSLHCIRCGACFNICPVYRHIGGHAYGSIYGGPIGSVITPLLTDNLDTWGELSYLSTLCGACTAICAVKIPLHELLLELRRRRAEAGYTKSSERWAFKGYQLFFDSPGRFNFAARAAHMFLRPMAKGGYIEQGPFALSAWTNSRYFPGPPDQTFRSWWDQTHERK